MKTPRDSTKHIASGECRILNRSYFQDSDQQGYTFVILFGINTENSTYTPRLQVGNFKQLVEKDTLVVLKKPNDSIEVILSGSTRILRIDEFELVRRCLKAYKTLEYLMRASTFNPIADTVYKWLIEARREHRLYSKDFYEVMRNSFIEVNLEETHKEPWIRPGGSD